MVNHISSLNQSLKSSAAGLSAQNKRLLVITQNIANADSKPSAPGGLPYRRKTISLGAETDLKTGTSLVKVKRIGQDSSDFKEVYTPNDPVADERGYVQMPNVDPMLEMIDMQEASLSHKANLQAYEKALKMMEETVGLLRN